MNLRRITLLSALPLCALGLLGAGNASAAPVWNLDLHHNETRFPPGGEGQYWVDVNNVGDTDTSGTISLTINLPPGITRREVHHYSDNFGPLGSMTWTCPGKAGASTVKCTTSGVVPRHLLSRNLVLVVDVAPEAEGALVATAELKGGGAANTVTVEESAQVDPVPAGFGILAESFVPDFFLADGLTSEREAGAHPDLATFPFDFNTETPSPAVPSLKREVESIRNIQVDLPPGFVGNPTTVGECSQAEFTMDVCPLSSQVGREDLNVFPLSAGPFEYFPITTEVYNLSHPRGTIADLAFVIGGNPIHIRASLNPANRYAITSTTPSINETLPPYHQKLTLWGVPADKSHDSERCIDSSSAGSPTGKECPTDATPKPFLALPSQCDEDNAFRLHHYDSWQNTGAYGPDITYAMPGRITDCEKPRFEPSVEAVPTGKQANTPTGLDVHIKVVQNENPNALATPPVKRAVVTLPEGMSFSPSFADGLQSCSPAQIGLFTNDPVRCPDASRIGEVVLSTPLLPKDAMGSMYLASQKDNPFNTTFALYMAIEDTEERGALVKVPGRIDVDPVTGQITTSFNELPQFPFDDFTLKFRSGPRAPLVSPPACGAHKIAIEVASYAQPTKPVDASNTYQVSEGPNGTPCPPDSAGRPFTPKFSGGTLNPVAGSYSTFLFRLSRDDSEQELSQVTTLLPQGLVAKIAGIPYCPEAAIASISEAEGAGKGELNSPACPAGSQIGTISAGLGAGPGPNYFGGKVYLAGPYKGAPLSLAVVAPGIAGPFDLGNVVVRAAIQVDPETAQVKAVSDSFPTKLHGVILRVRDVRLMVDRSETTLNPTSCSPMSVDGEISGVGGSLLSNTDDSLFVTSHPFQVGSCSDLSFKPRLSFRLFGGTKRGAHPKFRAVLANAPGGCQHLEGLCRATQVRVPRPVPHRHRLHQGAVQSQRLPIRLGLRRGCCQDPVARRAAERPRLPALLR